MKDNFFRNFLTPKANFWRRCVFLAITPLLLLPAISIPVSAAFPAGIAGVFYETDIRTYMFGAPITSYNIGGHTVINAEILHWHYGFSVEYDDEKRLLSINDLGTSFISEQAKSGELVVELSELSGNYARNYFYTDIVTTVNGKKINSYNFSGKTAIVAEELIYFGYSVVWDPDARTLSIDRPADFYTHSTELGTITSRTAFVPDGEVSVVNRALSVTDDNGKQHMLALPSGTLLCGVIGQSTFVRLSDVVSLLGSSLSIQYGDTLEITLSEATPPYQYVEHTNNDISSAPFILSEERPVSTGLRLTVNGVGWPVTRMVSDTSEETAEILIHEGYFYIPVHTAAKLLGFITGQ